MRYTIKPLNTTGMSVRSDHNTESPKIGSLPYTTTADGDILWEVTTSTSSQYVGDKWLKILTPSQGWVAVKHRGVTFCQLTENVLPPPVGVPTLVSAIVTYTVNGIQYTETLTK